MESIIDFVTIPKHIDGYGYGNGSGSGSGYSYGSGYSSGSGNGSGDGDGSGSGNGNGNGDGDGDGNGNGNGDGDGDGYGFGNGSGDGSGDGYNNGFGYDIKKYCDYDVYRIDSINTIIYTVHGNYAIGAIIKNDLTLQDCYIAKVGNYFAHGNTLKEAFEDAQAKYTLNLPIEERISMFKSEFTDYDKEYPCSKLYVWHNKLTGSCKFGRESFAKEHNIDIVNGVMTINDFIKLTKNSYRGDIINMLK